MPNPVQDAITSFMEIAAKAVPSFEALVATAEALGADVSGHKPLSQDFSDALKGLDAAVAAASSWF
jgi:hypothetical protein